MNTHSKTWFLSTSDEIKSDLPVTPRWITAQREGTEAIQNILDGENRQMLIIGPCSADFQDSLKEYGEFLAELQEEVREKILLVMRFYTGKPRTIGGWKGLQQGAPGEPVDIDRWLREARKIAVELLDLGIPLADEMLHPQMMGHMEDLLSYIAVGARSTTNQYHREVASWAPMPVGFKNPESGDLLLMVNSIMAAQGPSDYTLANGRTYHGNGNPYAHAILRWSNFEWTVKSNYDVDSVQRFLKFAEKVKLLNPKLLIDTNHDNSGKKPEKQIEIMREIMQMLRDFPDMRLVMKGFMVESYLHDWRQDGTWRIIHGKSLTDPCIGRENTRALVMELAEKI